MLYPEPTAWSSHPLIAISEKGKRLIEAMMDKEVQKIAWERHGFRSGTGEKSDVKAFKIQGIPENLDKVISMPSSRVMNTLMNRLSTR